MAISTIVPACMACTITTVPQIIPSNGTIFFTGDDSIETLPTKEYLYASMQTARPLVPPRPRPITKMDIFPGRQPLSVHRISSMKNGNRKNRKHHNIHQPGRTNCTQRYQGK